MADWKHDRVGAALRGEHPNIIAELEHTFVAMGDVQFLPGYCVVLTNQQGIDKISELPRDQRLAYWADVDLVATAMENVLSARDPEYRRLNIELLGNRDAFLHTHIFPRFTWEPHGLVNDPLWKYPAEVWTDPANQLGEQHADLRASLAAEINRLKDDLGSAERHGLQ